MSCCSASGTCPVSGAKSSSAPAPAAVFSRIGKGVRDLFKKNFDYNKTAKVTRKPFRPLSVEATADASAQSGSYKLKYVDNTWGEAEVEGSTKACVNNATVTLKKLADGVTVTVGAKGDKCSNASGKLEVEYAQPKYTTQVNVNSDLCLKKPLFTFAGSANVASNVTVGAQLGVCPCDDAATCCSTGACPYGKKCYIPCSKACTTLDFGVEYSCKKITASAYTEQNGSALNLSYLVNLGGSQLAALYSRKLPYGSCCPSGETFSSDDKLTVGLSHNLDATTLLKTKADLPSGVVSAAVERKFSVQDFPVSVQVAASSSLRDNLSKSSPAFTPAKFGVSFSLGN